MTELMASAVRSGSPFMVFSGKPKVIPAQIPSAIGKLWREAAELDQAKADDKKARIKATLSNLIMLADEESQSFICGSLDELITELCIGFPSRFFVVGLNSEELALETGVSSRCVLARSGSHVCSEEVYVRGGGSTADLIPNLLLSLLVPDVESTLLLLSDPLGRGFDSNVILSSLSRSKTWADRLLYDSSTFEKYGQSVSSLFDTFLSEGEGGAKLSTQIVDLQWLRLERWRSLIAEQFDSAALGDPRSDIARLGLRVKAKGADSVPGDAFLLASWIVSALSWGCPNKAKVEANKVSWRLQTQERAAVELEIEWSEPEEGVNAGLETIGLELVNGSRVSVARCENEPQLEVISCLGGSEPDSRRVVPIGGENIESLILSELIRPTREESFFKTLQTSLVLAGGL